MFGNCLASRRSAWRARLGLRGRRLSWRSGRRLFHGTKWLRQGASLPRAGCFVDQHLNLVSGSGASSALCRRWTIARRHTARTAQELLDLISQRIGLLARRLGATRRLCGSLRLNGLLCGPRLAFWRSGLFVRFDNLPNYPHHEHQETHETAKQLADVAED
jgi:hypothetical protein